MRTIVIFVFLTISLRSYGSDIVPSYCYNYTGQNARLGFGYYLGTKIRFETGIKFHINNPNSIESRSYVYKNKFYAHKFSQKIGFYHLTQFFIKYREARNYNFYLFNDVTIQHIGLKYRDYVPFEKDSNGRSHYIYSEHNRPPFSSLEFNLGLGLRTKLTEKAMLGLEFGTGFIYLRDKPYFYRDQFGTLVHSGGSPTYDPFTNHLRCSFLYRLK